MDKLLPYTNNKEQGGSRTTHQLNQAFNLLNYTNDLFINKINEDPNQKQKISQEGAISLTKKILTGIKENLKLEKTNNLYFNNLINLNEKLLSLFKKCDYEFTEDNKLNKNLKSIHSTLEKVVDKLSLKNMEQKIKDISKKYFE